MEQPNTMYDFPIVWEDVLKVTDELDERISSVSDEQDKALELFDELLIILMDSPDLPDSLKSTISAKFSNKKK